MANTGWILAGRGRAVNRASGAAAWLNPSNITADDGTNATVQLPLAFGTQFSHWLVADQFDFSGIPAGATIDGIEVEARLNVDTAVNAIVSAVNIGKDDATPGTQKNPATALTTSAANHDYGSASDLWGLTISVAEVQDPDFQVLVSVGVTTAFALRNFSCDAFWMRVTYTGGAVNADAGITEANDTVSGSATVDLQASLSQTEGNDTLSGSAGVEIRALLTATEADDVPAAAGAVEITASAVLTEGDDTGATTATLMIGATAAITEGDDVPSSAGTVGIVGSLNVTEGNDTLAGTGTVGIFANAILTEGDDTLDGLAQMPIYYPRRGGIDEGQEFERRQREWQESLRRIIDRSFLIAYGIIDPVTFEPIPPPDYSPVIDTLIREALALDRERAEAFIAGWNRHAEEEAISVLLLAA